MRKPKVLVVDDNVTYCNGLVRELANTEMFDVQAVYDGLSAIRGKPLMPPWVRFFPKASLRPVRILWA